MEAFTVDVTLVGASPFDLGNTVKRGRSSIVPSIEAAKLAAIVPLNKA